MIAGFDQFWAAYPRKVGRFAALAEFVKARRHASVEQILAGVEQYKRTKPAYADWAHPRTWLRQGRWTDEPDEAPARYVWRCPHVDRCGHQAMCAVKLQLPAKYPVRAEETDE